MAVTDDAILRIRSLIIEGKLNPGDRLPQESRLADELGLSRNSMREAVRALEQTRVLEVRRGSGTYVTSLEPALLLEGISLAVDLLRDETLMEVLEVRQLLEPAATAQAARRMTPAKLQSVRSILDETDPDGPIEDLVRCDLRFHSAIVAAADNATLSSILDGLSTQTLRVRIWGGVVNHNAVQATIDMHERIYSALAEGDPVLAQAEALVHLRAAASWLRNELGPDRVRAEPPTAKGRGPRAQQVDVRSLTG